VADPIQAARAIAKGLAVPPPSAIDRRSCRPLRHAGIGRNARRRGSRPAPAFTFATHLAGRQM